MQNECNKTICNVQNKHDIAEFYSNYAESWDQRFRANMSTSYFLRRRIDIIKSLADFSGDECVLEVGCGTAFHLFSLSEYFNYGIGVDVSEKMLEMCTRNSRYLEQVDKLKFICDDAETLEQIASESINVVFFVGLIEHLLNPLRFLESCRKILKPGGKLIGITPNRYSPWYNLIGPLVRKSMKHLSTDRYYSKRELCDMLSSTGFTDCTLNYWGFVPPGDFPAILSSILRKCEIVAEKSFLRVLAGGLAIRAIKAKS